MPTPTVYFDTTLAKLRSLSGSFDLSALEQVSLQYEDDLNDLVNLGDDWSYTSIASTQIVVQNSGFTATLAGSGLSPVSTISQLEAAIDDGIAQGDFDTLTFTRGGTEIAELTFSSAGIAIATGNSVLTLSGALPGSFEEVFDFLDLAEQLDNIDSLTEAELDTLETDLASFGLTGISFAQNDETLLALTLSASGASLTAGGLTLTLDGTVPTDFGDLLALSRELDAQTTNTLDFYEGAVRLLDANGTEIPEGFYYDFDTGDDYEYYTYSSGFEYYDYSSTEAETFLVEISSPYGDGGDYVLEIYAGGPTTNEVDEDTSLGTTPQVVTPNARIFGSLEDGSDVDTYSIEVAPGTFYVSAYYYSNFSPIDSSLLTQLALTSGSLGLSGAAAPILTMNGDLTDFAGSELGLGNFEEVDVVVQANGSEFESIDLDLDMDGTSPDSMLYGDDFSNDLIMGYEGMDTIYGEGGHDLIDGGADDDQLFGNYENDTLFGGSGDDLLRGGYGGDVLHGGTGHDTVYGDDGSDLAFLGFGNDLFIDNGEGGPDGSDTVLAWDGNDTIQGGNGDDVFYGQNGYDQIFGRLGDDLLYGGAGYDTLNAGAGDDIVWGGNGRDLAILGDGDDLFWDNGQGGVNGRDTVWAGNGNDTIQGGNGNDALHGQSGADVIWARLGDDFVAGGDWNDTIYAGDGNDTVFGGNGRDFTFLGAGQDVFNDNAQTGVNGHDFVFGAAGDDVIRLQGGNDTAEGGTGADTFEFVGTGFGSDVIKDYEVGVDMLIIDGSYLPVDQAALDAMSDTSSGDLVITFAADAIITFEGLTSNAGLLDDMSFPF